MLCLPENHAAYSSLTDKGLHTAYLTLNDKYPIKSHKLQRGLQRYLLSLTHAYTHTHTVATHYKYKHFLQNIFEV